MMETDQAFTATSARMCLCISELTPLIHLASIACFFGPDLMWADLLCLCVYQQCAISAPCSKKTKGNKETREWERHSGGKIARERENKRIVFIISSRQRNLITLIQQRGLIAKTGSGEQRYLKCTKHAALSGDLQQSHKNAQIKCILRFYLNR